MENTIEFKGPFNINHLDKNLELEIDKPGIYIWGFMVDSNYNPLNCKNIVSFSSEKMKFLPYYVGKKEGRIIDRLNEHKNVRENVNAIKYTRLSIQYLKTFFNDPLFPIKTSYSNITNKFIEIDKKSNHTLIEYYNNSKFLDYKINGSNNDKSKINNEKPTNNPITNFCTINDTLQEIIIGKNNFWFCYAELKENIDFFKSKLLDFETLTYYSLKGKTISKTEEFKTISDNIQVKCNDNLINVFKEKVLTKKIITEKYLNENNEVKFPGY